MWINSGTFRCPVLRSHMGQLVIRMSGYGLITKPCLGGSSPNSSPKISSLPCSKIAIGSFNLFICGIFHSAPSKKLLMWSRSLSVLRLMLVLIQNTHKKIIQIGQDYNFLGIISPYATRKTQRRFRLKAIHTSTHSPFTASKPRSIKRRKPMTSLIIPNTGSTVDLRCA